MKAGNLPITRKRIKTAVKHTFLWDIDDVYLGLNCDSNKSGNIKKSCDFKHVLKIDFRMTRQLNVE